MSMVYKVFLVLLMTGIPGLQLGSNVFDINAKTRKDKITIIIEPNDRIIQDIDCIALNALSEQLSIKMIIIIEAFFDYSIRNGKLTKI